MKILVDGDACPVKNIVIETAKKYNLKVLIFINESQELDSDYAKIIRVSSGKDVADFELINKTETNDIVASNDYGVLTMALAKKAIPINFDGVIFTELNINTFLMNRYLNEKSRKAKKYVKGPSKRKNEDNLKFEEVLNYLILKNITEEI